MLDIDKDKHLKMVIDKWNEAVEDIERAYKHPELKEIIDIAVGWYESNDTTYYSFFDKAFPTCIGPTEFYAGLASFLINTILDDSYFLVKWKKYDSSNGGYKEGVSFQDIPYVVWAGDDGINKPEKMLEAMKYEVERERKRKEWYENDAL